MAQEPPKSRPEPPVRPRRVGNPQTPGSIYGDQWGRSGKQNEGGKGEPDRPEPAIDPRKAK